MEKPHAASAPPPPQCSSPSTTFVRADAATFKEVVQRLTGPHEQHDPLHRFPSQPADAAHASPSSSSSPAKLSGLKRLHERRQGSRLKLTIRKPGSQPKPPGSGVQSPSVTIALSSPIAGFAGLNICEEKGIDGTNELNEEEEERAIKERRFYLHPSPRSRPRNAERELLPLFPLTSTKPGDP